MEESDFDVPELCSDDSADEIHKSVRGNTPTTAHEWFQYACDQHDVAAGLQPAPSVKSEGQHELQEQQKHIQMIFSRYQTTSCVHVVQLP